MSQESFIFTGVNGQEMFVRNWSGNTGPRCILLIIHGMAEHGGRYSDFAGFLNERGITVYATDLRGHGETGERNSNLCELPAFLSRYFRAPKTRLANMAGGRKGCTGGIDPAQYRICILSYMKAAGTKY